MKTFGLLVAILVTLAASSPTEIVKNQNSKILMEDLLENGQLFSTSKVVIDVSEDTQRPGPDSFGVGNIGVPRSMVNYIGLKPTILKPFNGTCSNGYRLDRQKMCRLVWK